MDLSETQAQAPHPVIWPPPFHLVSSGQLSSGCPCSHPISRHSGAPGEDHHASPQCALCSFLKGSCSWAEACPWVLASASCLFFLILCESWIPNPSQHTPCISELKVFAQAVQYVQKPFPLSSATSRAQLNFRNPGR